MLIRLLWASMLLLLGSLSPSAALLRGSGGVPTVTISGVNCSTCSFAGGLAAGSNISPVTVSLSSGSFANVFGSVALTGVNTGSGNDAGDFQMIGCPSACELQAAASPNTTQPGQYSINFVVSCFCTNSGATFSQTVQATGPGGSGWQLVLQDEFNDPLGMIENRAKQAISSISWDSGHGGEAAIVLPQPSAIQSIGQEVSLYGVTNSVSGASSFVNGLFIIISYTDSQHFTIAMPALASQIGTLATDAALLGTGPWVLPSVDFTTNPPTLNYSFAVYGDGDVQGWNPHNCQETPSSGLSIKMTNTGWTDPNGASYTYAYCDMYAWNNNLKLTYTGNELYYDTYGKIPSGNDFHTGWYSDSLNYLWNNGPEDDVAEFWASPATEHFTIWPGSGGSKSSSSFASPTGDFSTTFHEYGNDLIAGVISTYYYDGTSESVLTSGLPPTDTVWIPDLLVSSDTISGTSPTVFPNEMDTRYLRIYLKVSSGACYSSIPSATSGVIPHTGSC